MRWRDGGQFEKLVLGLCVAARGVAANVAGARGGELEAVRRARDDQLVAALDADAAVATDEMLDQVDAAVRVVVVDQASKYVLVVVVDVVQVVDSDDLLAADDVRLDLAEYLEVVPAE